MDAGKAQSAGPSGDRPRAVPEPAAGAEAGGRRGTRRHRRIRLVAAVAVAAALAAPLVLVQIRDAPSTGTPAEVSLRVSALEQREPLGATGAGAMDTTALVHPGEGSLVATRGAERIYLLEAAGNRLCVLVVNEGSGGAGSSCHPRSRLVDTGIVHAHHPATTGPTTFIVVAPDGYSTATAGEAQAAIVRNVALLEPSVPRPAVTISGPAVPDVSFRLGATGADGPGGADANARAALADLVRAAQAYQRTHGTSAGFAEQLLADNPAIGRQMASVTDTAALARVGPDRCLRADLRSGRIDEHSC